MRDQLKVMSTLAVELALKTVLLPAWQTESRQVAVDWNPTGVLIDRVRNGERGDVLIAIDEPIENLVEAGILRAGSVRPIARASFGLGTRSGMAMPDISTPERFKQALLSARSIAYSQTGASGIHFRHVLERLGIAEAVNAKATIIHAGFTADQVIAGEADLAVQQISELMSIDGIDVVGPFPDPYQKHTDFSAAIFAEACSPEAAEDFLDHLSNGKAAAIYSRTGLLPRHQVAA
ncbi:molybdate ABC transporter substrate-binding protein [Brucella pseudogrignonensis]|uniref:Bacterial extracellular solute-binding family protein n=1 Tax=Brucella pseudogrignonensis TaxID=419475 RepID=A0A256GW70_9HYPH|nr:substrate-binding domain-containing protein [Brucella pseudogrignonensis]OYR30976.1 bacterial extracellular solute-binding family protein [Brucella pseudogrignonensis]